MELFGQSMSVASGVLLLLALALALAFEFVNGFHDTANAVATVIYTHSLRPGVAVVWSGLWNLIGVLVSSGAVAFGVVALLPVELVLNVGSGAGFAMVFSLLVSAILWNLGTWYIGLPASSSHTLIGSILGVGLAYSFVTPGYVFGEGVNWTKANEVFAALVLSPIAGFTAAGLLLLATKALIRRPELYRPADPSKTPPLWIRSILILTCTGVSFAHGSNDGQKGMGLIMLILIGLVPATYALNLGTSAATIEEIHREAVALQSPLDRLGNGSVDRAKAVEELSGYLKVKGMLRPETLSAMASLNRDLSERLASIDSFTDLTKDERSAVRTDMYLIEQSLAKYLKSPEASASGRMPELQTYRGNLRRLTDFIPFWVKVAVAIALGFGTMIGWKRIVITVGEKIGKQHLSYAQGASAELVAMGTILIADTYGLPVSTTHVLSSGIAGTMAANHSGLQMNTLRNILMAWVLTLPVCVVMGAALFSFGFYIVTNVLRVS
jgi:PiT family inorganic phosphate transporter